MPAMPYAAAVNVDSASRTSPSPARKSCFVKPWLLNITASGGPEIVVTEYSTPRPPPKTSPRRRSSLMGLRKPAACSRIRGSRTMNVPSLSRAECHARGQAENHRHDPTPDVWDARPVDPEDVRVQGHFDPDEGRVQDPVRVKEQSHRHRDRRESVAERAVDGSCEQRDDD